MPKLQPLKPIARRALSTQSDERLVRLVREGHDPAFEEIVRRYRGPLVGFATAIVSANGAEDVVQASLAKAHSALLEDSREIALRPWLFAIVRNGALNSVRGQPRVDELDEALAAHSNPSDIAEQRDELDRLVIAMCALPDAQRQALVKRELEGVGHGEIAAQLGTSATAVRGLIFRARTQLRNAMGALVPLPVLRALLAQGTTASAAGAAGGMAGGAGSAAMLGGAGAKGGAVLAAAVLAVGGGIALEKRHRGHGDVESASAATQDDGSSVGNGSGTKAPGTSTTASTDVGGSGGGSPGGQDGSDGSRAGSSGGSGDSGGPDSGSGGSTGSSGSSGSGSGTSGSSSGPGGNHGSGSPPPVSPPSGDDDHSGPGSGHDDGGDEVEMPEVEDDSSGHGSDHETETESETEVEDDSSGPGGGDDSEESDDHSGHGILQPPA